MSLIRTVVLAGSMALSAVSAQAQGTQPSFEDSLYMLGRQQEAEIRSLREQITELQKQLAALKPKEQSGDTAVPSSR